MKRNNLITRLLLLIMLSGAAGFSAFAQTLPTAGKDILLYETDFQNWVAMSDDGGTPNILITRGGGAGFRLIDRYIVNPTGSTCNSPGFLEFTRDGGRLETPEFNFVQGGVVEIWFCSNTTSSGRFITVENAVNVGIEGNAVPPNTFIVAPRDNGRYDEIGIGNGATITTHMAVGTSNADRVLLDMNKVGVYFPGNSWVPRSMGHLHKVSFQLPASFTGLQRVRLGGRDHRIISLKVYSTVGSTPYVAATNYVNFAHNPDAGGHVMQGAVAGGVNSGTPVNDLVNIIGWNITGDVTLSIEGAYASRFSFPNANADGTLTVPNTNALAGINIPINFTPSVREGVVDAVLVITNPNNPAQTYRVSLTGITGSGTTNPTILASTATIPFYTYRLAPVTQNFSLAGVNLTGPITVSFDGPAASQFTVNENSIPVASAHAGQNIIITFRGTTAVSEHSDTYMVLSSPSAETVRVPLFAVTRNVQPTLFSLTFEVQPSGTAYIEPSLAGPWYEEGTTLTVSAEPETGYVISHWSDNPGSSSSNRTFRIIRSNGNRHVILYTLEADVPCPPNCPPVSSTFVAHTPPASSVTNDGFPASWTSAEDATAYTIIVYDKNGVEIDRIVAGMTNSFNLTGLAPALPTSEDDFFRFYEVEANVPVSAEYPNGIRTTQRVGPIRLTGTLPFICGQ